MPELLRHCAASGWRGGARLSASLSKITIDIAWSAGAALDNTNVGVVPEPGALALLGVVGALFIARRRRLG